MAKYANTPEGLQWLKERSLKKKVNLTKAEKQYFENLILYEMPQEREKLARLYRVGVDINAELDKLIKKHNVPS